MTNGLPDFVENNLFANHFLVNRLPKSDLWNVDHDELQEAYERVLDAAALVCKEEDLDIPAEEYTMIDELAEHGVLTQDQAATLKGMKGFHKRLVHRYGPLDEEQAFTDIKDGLDDFTELFNAFRTYAE